MVNVKGRISGFSRSDAWWLILLLSLGFWGSVTILAVALVKIS